VPQTKMLKKKNRPLLSHSLEKKC